MGRGVGGDALPRRNANGQHTDEKLPGFTSYQEKCKLKLNCCHFTPVGMATINKQEQALKRL